MSTAAGGLQIMSLLQTRAKMEFVQKVFGSFGNPIDLK